MRKSFILFISVLFLLAGLSAFAADGEFMADFRQSSSWQEGQNGKIYFKGGSSRMEFVRDGRTSEIMILNLKNKKAWMLNTEDKTFMEINFQDKPWQPAGADKSGKVTETKLGRETVSGYLCEKTRYTYQDDPASETMVWMSPKLGYPVKWEHTGAEGKTAFQLSKI
ncbi:MAG: DUF4412 domain-containing protein, partial [Smithella sp.]|nr:DUF4412 domain-containing protein [Smithella sp.]